MRIGLIIIILLAVVLGFGTPGVVHAGDQESQTLPQEDQADAVVYFFWGDGCPHCEAAKPFLENLVKKYPGVELRSYEVWNNVVNRNFFTQFMAAHDAEPRYVPVIFIGDQYWEGYREDLNSEIESALANCVNSSCPDAARGVSLPNGDQVTSADTGLPPWAIAGVIIVVGGLIWGGYTFFQAKAKENQRKRKIDAKQGRRRKREG
jgi:thiol-disulfide isomerase/thioredoxin